MEQLMAMGFEKDEVKYALQQCSGNFELALDSLLMQQQPQRNVTSSSHNSETNRVVRLEISQYTFGESGSSACTVIASSMMKFLLEQLPTQNQAQDIFDSSVLTEVIMSGVSKFNEIFSNSHHHVAVDEMGAFFDTVHPVGAGLYQGILSNPRSMEEVFNNIQSSSSKHLGIVITKPPETVSVILPPRDQPNAGYIFFDSHSRPQDGFEGAYLIIYRSQRGLLDRIKHVFPSFGFGVAESNYMSDMYNMFEASPFELNK